MTDRPSSSLKEHVGINSEMYSEKITADRIQAFCRAVGASTAMPPTFLTLFRRGEFDLLRKIGVDLARVLHAEQEYDYEDEIRSNDKVFYQTQLETVLEKQTAEVLLGFMTFKTQIYAEGESSARRNIGTATSVIVLRDKKAK